MADWLVEDSREAGLTNNSYGRRGDIRDGLQRLGLRFLSVCDTNGGPRLDPRLVCLILE